MVRPRLNSWILDELLQPHVHYLPLSENFDNIEEHVQWIVDHDEEAKQIAHRSSLWIQDLFFHPNATADNRAVQKAILKRYAQHFAAL